MQLNTNTKSVEVVLGAAVATNQLDVTFEYTETESVAAASISVATNNTTRVTAVQAPATGTKYKVVGGRIANRDTAPSRVFVHIYDGTTRWQQVDVDLAPRSTLQYDGKEWTVILADGSIKTGVAGPAGPQGPAGSAGAAGATGSAGPTGPTGANGTTSLSGINDQTGTSYTLVLTDVGKDIRCTNAAAITLTVPPNSSVAFNVGSVILFSQGGAGAVTAVAGSGVTLRAAYGVATTALYDIRGLEKTDTDTWRVV